MSSPAQDAVATDADVRDVVVRDLQEADIAALQQIDREAHGSAWSRHIFLDQINGADRLHLVASKGDSIAAHGAIWFDQAFARVTNVAVAPFFRGAGLGALIMGHLCEHARSRVHATAMSLEVASANLTAQSLYRSFGFMPVGVDRSFYGPGKDALVMTVPDVGDPAWVRRIVERTAVKGVAAP